MATVPRRRPQNQLLMTDYELPIANDLSLGSSTH
jgi:hypothetical protein